MLAIYSHQKTRGLSIFSKYTSGSYTFWEWSRPYCSRSRVGRLKGPKLGASIMQFGCSPDDRSAYSLAIMSTRLRLILMIKKYVFPHSTCSFPLSICNYMENLWGTCLRPACTDTWVAACMWSGQTPPKPALFILNLCFDFNFFSINLSYFYFPCLFSLPFSYITPTNTHTHTHRSQATVWQSKLLLPVLTQTHTHTHTYMHTHLHTHTHTHSTHTHIHTHTHTHTHTHKLCT